MLNKVEKKNLRMHKSNNACYTIKVSCVIKRITYLTCMLFAHVQRHKKNKVMKKLIEIS